MKKSQGLLQWYITQYYCVDWNSMVELLLAGLNQVYSCWPAPCNKYFKLVVVLNLYWMIIINNKKNIYIYTRNTKIIHIFYIKFKYACLKWKYFSVSWKTQVHPLNLLPQGHLREQMLSKTPSAQIWDVLHKTGLQFADTSYWLL